MNARTSRILSVCALLSFAFTSCSKPKSSAEQQPPQRQAPPAATSSAAIAHPFKDLRDVPGTVFDVSYTPQTVRIDQSSWRASLKSVSSDGNVFVFDNPDANISSLHEGSTMFLESLAVRSVRATATRDGHFVVNTDRAGITDLIQNGTIHWRVPINFGAEQAHYDFPAPLRQNFLQSWASRLNPEQVASAAGTSVNLSGKLDGWDYKINATPSSNRLDMSFAVHKELDTLIVNVNAQGFLKDFFSAADMHIQQGSLDNFSYDANGLNGQLDINFEGGRGTGSAVGVDVPNIKLPPIYRAPMPIAGIPFIMTINANLILKPGFGGKNETMKGSFHINYNGDEGITVKAGQASASPGSLSGDGSLGQMLSVSIAPHAILVGMAAPKITLSLGTESITDLLNEAMPSSLADSMSDILAKTGVGKWAKKKLDKSFKTEASANVQNVAVATVTAQGSVGMIPCKLSRLLLEFKGGADAYLLGKKIGDKEIIMFKKELVNREPDINACGDK
jgi:hypothetical protein